ncbi:MAG: DUF4190 domain-containing protein [Chloroflexota bacterium]
MFTLGPMELVICLVPAVVVIVIAVIVIYTVRKKPTKAIEANSQEIAQKDSQTSDSINDVSRNNTSTETAVNSYNGLATTSLVLSILALIVHILFGATWSNCIGPIAMITGAISLLQIMKKGGKGKWVAIAGIGLGTLPFIITLVTVLLITITESGR